MTREKIEEEARTAVEKHRPEPLKCADCGKAQSTGPMAGGMMWFDRCEVAKNGHHSYLMILKSPEQYEAEAVQRLADFALLQVQLAVSEREREIVRKLRERIDVLSSRSGCCTEASAGELDLLVDWIEHGEVTNK